MNVIFGVETITPEIAAEMLKNNDCNRPLSQGTIDSYAGIMKRGKWLMNGETIVLSDSGRILQGQHRLFAVIAAGLPVQFAVIRGMDPAVFPTYDQGKRRTKGDILAIAGERNGVVLAGGLSAIKKLTSGAPTDTTMTSDQAMSLLEAYPEVRYWTSRFVAHRSFKAIFPTAICGALTLASRKYGFEVVERFFDQISSGEGLKSTDPAYLLREKFISRAKGSQFTTTGKLAYIVRALSAHCQGKTMKILRWKDNEEFPKL